MGMNEHPLPFPPAAQRQPEGSRTLLSLAGVQGTRVRDLGHCLVPPSLEWILRPREGRAESPTLFLFPAYLDASWALRREMLSCFLKITFMSGIARALEFREPAC